MGSSICASIERAAFFGESANTTTVDPDTGQTVPRRFTGGLRWFLDQWEIGNSLWTTKRLSRS